jgi:hypothetical protein
MLQGGTGGYEELLYGDEKIDRSLQELMTLSRLHGVVRYLMGEVGDRAEAITLSTFERYVCEHQMTEDGQVRKWLTEGDAYHRDRLQRAVEGSNRGKHERFLHRDPSPDKERWTNTYSQVTRELVRFSIDLLVGELEMFYKDAEDLWETAAVLYHLDLDPDTLQALIENPPPLCKIPPGGCPGTYRWTNARRKRR